MAHSNIKASKKSDEIAFRNFIAARQSPNLHITYHFDKSENEEFVIFNHYYKEKIDVENEKIKLEKLAAQKFKNCPFKCVILRHLVTITEELFNGCNYVTKFRFQRITYLDKSIFTTSYPPQPRQRLLSYRNDDKDDFFNYDRF